MAAASGEQKSRKINISDLRALVCQQLNRFETAD
jgi:hypothetical protein